MCFFYISVYFELYKRPYFIRCVKPNRQQLPEIYDEISVRNQLETSGTMAYYSFMQLNYPIKFSISGLFEKLQAFLEPRHLSFGANNCCRIFLLAIGVPSKDFKFGKSEIHIRRGHQIPALDTVQLPNYEIIKIKQEFKFFMRRVLKIRFKFLGKRKYYLIHI